MSSCPPIASRKAAFHGCGLQPHCPLCGRPGDPLADDLEDLIYGVEGRWSWRACPGCRIAWLTPRPSPMDFERMYRDYFTHSRAETVDAPKKRIRERIKEAALAKEMGIAPGDAPWRRRVAAAAALCIPRYRELVRAATLWLSRGEGGALLDVGCGDGSFLKRMRDLGWKVRGIDPDRRVVDQARSRFALEVEEARLEEIHFPGDSFDAVVAGHVIEHVHDPLSFFVECRRILKTGGQLVVLTPNYLGLQRRWLGRRWNGLDCPRHLYLFSRRSLRRCCEMAGLHVVTLRTTAREGKNFWLLSREQADVRRASAKRRPLGLRIEALMYDWIERSALLFWPDAGAEILLIARK